MTRTLEVLLGAWLIAAGLLLAGPGAPARLADVAAGAALVAIALLARPGTGPGFTAILLGCWVMVAPIFLRYPAARNAVLDVVTGFAIVAVWLRPRPLGWRRPARA
jgi:hypothetical protein